MVDTAFTLLAAEEDCQISSALAASLHGSEISSHQVSPDVWREMIEKETFEEKTFFLVNPVGEW